MSLAADGTAPALVVGGTRIDVIERGSGRPLLFLHAENGIEPAGVAIDELAKGARVIAPTHPGFGRSELPKGMRTVDDLSYFYLDLLDQLDLRDLTVVGVSLGGWIAAEIAVKSSARFAKLVMANAVGVKGIRVERAEDLRSALMEAFAHDGPVLVDVVSARQELAMPPTTTFDEAYKFGLFMIKAVLDGRGSQLVDLAKVNLLR